MFSFSPRSFEPLKNSAPRWMPPRKPKSSVYRDFRNVSSNLGKQHFELSFCGRFLVKVVHAAQQKLCLTLWSARHDEGAWGLELAVSSFERQTSPGSRPPRLRDRDVHHASRTIAGSPRSSAYGPGDHRNWVAVKELKLSYHNGYIVYNRVSPIWYLKP